MRSKLATLLALAGALTAGEAAAAGFPLTTFKLDNGLEVIVQEDRRAPVVAVNLWYHVGSKDEPDGKNGFAHLFEHLMFQGSRHVPEDKFFQLLERAGASDKNGTTNTDRTNYYEVVPSHQLELALWLESDRMAFLLDHVDDRTLSSQRDVVKNERRQNYENAPYGLVYQFVRAALFPKGHPYHRLTIGTPEDLDAASLADVRAFFKRYYVPNNATLVLAGDLDPARAKELVGKWFGPIVAGADAKSVRAPMPVARAAEQRLSIEADVELARVSVSWVTPPGFAPGDGELDALAHVLATGKSSRLYKRLVHDAEIAQDVSAHQASSLLASQFEISVTVQRGKRADEALAMLDDELGRLLRDGPAADEVARAKARLVADLTFSVERVGARANQLNAYAQSTGDPAYFERDVARYRALTPESLKRAAAAHLAPAARVVATVTPTPGAPKAGRLVGGAP